MAASLIKHELIRTTLPKAKELRRVAEPLITLGKVDGVANRRLAFSRLRDKQAVGKLFVELGPRYASIALGDGQPPQNTLRPADVTTEADQRRNDFRRRLNDRFASRRRTADRR